MVEYKRLLKMDLPPRQSAFLWGARKTGKSTYLRQKFPNAVYYDLLHTELFMRFSKAPNLLRDQVLDLPPEKLQFPVIIDEVQVIPQLLNEVHWLIENSEANFILCGSSARKLRTKGVNLLGGRAWKYHFFPLVSKEIADFSLHKVINNGTIPSHYSSSNPKKSLSGYIEDYLRLEIQFEGVVRDLPAFARFMDSMAFSSGQMTNYSNISRDCGIDAKTVKEYYQILVDTLLGYYVLPYTKKSSRRDLITSVPKFYLFDAGVVRTLSKRSIVNLEGPEAGMLLEHYVLHELTAFKYLMEKDFEVFYWRTKTGLEIDFVLANTGVAIEVKISKNIHSTEFKAAKAFLDEHDFNVVYFVCLEQRSRRIVYNNKVIRIMHIEEFLAKLWDGDIV